MKRRERHGGKDKTVRRKRVRRRRKRRREDEGNLKGEVKRYETRGSKRKKRRMRRQRDPEKEE